MLRKYSQHTHLRGAHRQVVWQRHLQLVRLLIVDKDPHLVQAPCARQRSEAVVDYGNDATRAGLHHGLLAHNGDVWRIGDFERRAGHLQAEWHAQRRHAVGGCSGGVQLRVWRWRELSIPVRRRKGEGVSGQAEHKPSPGGQMGADDRRRVLGPSCCARRVPGQPLRDCSVPGPPRRILTSSRAMLNP
eukprot:360008-Chlamydomonas_euryale.AAC.2